MSKLFVVGIGPGDYQHLTIQADRILQSVDLIVGYKVYVNLVKQFYPDKAYLSTGMTQEIDRCQLALDRARAGESVALVCSGDSGIYGLASLAYELRGEEDRPEIEVIPGLTAASSGAALLGAPLTHDFALISLSDRLTPWAKIEARLLAAAKSDLAIVLYNPASRGRPDHLRRACDLLLTILPPDRPCALARQIGRPGEATQYLSLADLRELEADMFCTVFIGNQMSRKIAGKLVTPRGYHHA